MLRQGLIFMEHLVVTELQNLAACQFIFLNGGVDDFKMGKVARMAPISS